MILIQIATALAIGAYVVLSKDAQPKRPNATPRESFEHAADHLVRIARTLIRNRAGHSKIAALLN